MENKAEPTSPLGFFVQPSNGGGTLLGKRLGDKYKKLKKQLGNAHERPATARDVSTNEHARVQIVNDRHDRFKTSGFTWLPYDSTPATAAVTPTLTVTQALSSEALPPQLQYEGDSRVADPDIPHNERDSDELHDIRLETSHSSTKRPRRRSCTTLHSGCHRWTDSFHSVKSYPSLSFVHNLHQNHNQTPRHHCYCHPYCQQDHTAQDVSTDSDRQCLDSVHESIETTSDMETLNIALIGAANVGKSSFIQRVLGLSKLPDGYTTSTRIVIDRVQYMVILIEMDLEHFDLNPNRGINWPRQVAGHILPGVDGALILYDVTNRDSVTMLPQALFPDGMFRRRAQSAVHIGPPPTSGNGRPISPSSSRHVRASSDVAHMRTVAPSQTHETEPPTTASSSKPPRIDFTSPISTPFLFSSQSPQEGQSTSVSDMLRTPGGVRIDGGPELLSMPEPDEEQQLQAAEDIPILQRGDDVFLERPAKLMGLSFEELVDRLVAQKMTRSDHNFNEIFLCLYRKFASPSQLFKAILGNLDKINNDKKAHYLTRIASQLRVIEVVTKWVASYPGDFARPASRTLLEEFVGNLAAEPIFNAAAMQMRRNLDVNVVEDDDTGWEMSDDMPQTSESASMALPPPSAALAGANVESRNGGVRGAGGSSDFTSAAAPVSAHDQSRDGELVKSSLSSLHLEVTSPKSMADQRRVSASSDASHHARNLHGMPFQFYTPEDYEREAAALVPLPTLVLSKPRYHAFLQISDDDVAEELTRIDWIMFLSIRIRDLVRHVSLSAAQKEKCRRLRNIDRMVDHFNHVALWVANMVLMRSKPKHRAVMLEKFMNIALKLRQLNNYNGLAAVLAGINSTAVHRLTQTRALVPVEVYKRFTRLGLLMGTQKSHFAYRLAWENSPTPRIPFMPLHRRDLVSAETGSKTYVGQEGDRINWKKFEVLGEVLLPIIRSHGVPYTSISKHPEVRRLLLDCILITDEEHLYQHSVQVESHAEQAAEVPKKRFPWFVKP